MQPTSKMQVTVTSVRPEDDSTSESYVVPKADERAAILEQQHLLGHFGASAMVRSLQLAGVRWPNMQQDALAVCQRCVQCLRYNSVPKGYHPLRPIHAALPFDHVAMDLAGPFTTSSSGNHFLHVMIDVHSRFVLLKAIPDKRMETIAALWLETFMVFGFPKIIQSDNGGEFIGKMVKTMLKMAGVDQRFISAYHPRGNGLCERAVQTATRAIKKLLQGMKHKWDVFVPFVQYCINQKVVERHGERPFTVMFGRQANAFANFSDLPIPPGYFPTAASHEQDIATVRERIKTMQLQLFPDVANKSMAMAAKHKKVFDGKHKMVDLPINTFVMLRDNTRKSKMEPANEGPFKIRGKTRGGSYILEDNSGELLPRNYPPSAIISLSTNPTFEQESYQVEAIVDHRETDGDIKYKVRWLGYSPQHDTWELASSFDDHGVIHKYWARRGCATPKTMLKLAGENVV